MSKNAGPVLKKTCPVPFSLDRNRVQAAMRGTQAATLISVVSIEAAANVDLTFLISYAPSAVPDFHDSRMRKLYEKLQEEHSKQQNARGVTSWTPFPTHPAKWGVTPFTTSAWRAMFSRHGLQMPSHFFVRDGTLITTQLSGRPSSEESTGSSSAGPRQPHRVTTCSTAVNSSTSNVLARIASSRHDTLDDLDASNTAPVRTPPGPEKANLVKTSKVDRMSDAVFGRAALDPAVANETLAEIKKEVAMYQQALAPLLLQQKKYEHLVQMHSAQGSQ